MMKENKLLTEIAQLLAFRVDYSPRKVNWYGLNEDEQREALVDATVILAKIREVVEGAELTEDIIADYMVTPEAMKRAILKAMGRTVKNTIK